MGRSHLATCRSRRFRGDQLGRCYPAAWCVYACSGCHVHPQAAPRCSTRRGAVGIVEMRRSHAPTFLVGSIYRSFLAVHGAAGVGGTACRHADRSIQLPRLSGSRVHRAFSPLGQPVTLPARCEVLVDALRYGQAGRARSTGRCSGTDRRSSRGRFAPTAPGSIPAPRQ